LPSTAIFEGKELRIAIGINGTDGETSQKCPKYLSGRCINEKPGKGLTPMAHEQMKVTDKSKGALKEGANKQVRPEFDRPLGSSHDDKIDLRDVAQEAAKKSK
jgi:hypothetical protein